MDARSTATLVLAAVSVGSWVVAIVSTTRMRRALDQLIEETNKLQTTRILTVEALESFDKRLSIIEDLVVPGPE